MKKMLQAFTSFTHTERMGIVGLLLLIVALITLRFTMHHFVSVETKSTQEKQLAIKWAAFNILNNNPLAKSETKQGLYTSSKTETKRNKKLKYPATQKFPINTVDSLQLVSIWGIGSKLAHRILDYRRANGNFTSHEQLLEVYRFSDTVFSILKDRLILDSTE